jgi:hypothetical protein
VILYVVKVPLVQYTSELIHGDLALAQPTTSQREELAPGLWITALEVFEFLHRPHGDV